MKTLQIINSLETGGAEKLLIDSIPIYKQKNVDMELLLLNGDKTPFFQQLEKQKVKTHTLNIKKTYNPLLVFRIIPYLKKYDIIHAHLFPTLYWVALAKIFSKTNAKLIFTEHSTNNKRIEKGGIWKFLDKLMYRQYDKIVSITSQVDEVIQHHLSGTNDKFRIINNGIDVSQYVDNSTESKSKITDKSKITIIQVGAFRKDKDQPTLIRALQYLSDNAFLVLVGDGEFRSKCEQLTTDLNLSDRVSFLGIRTDVPQLLKSSDIAVVSSHWEGFGLAAVEGMAAKKPVIASDVSGLRDVVADAGLLFPPENEKLLAEQINALISNPELYKKVSQNCFERAKQYDINVMIDKYIELYKEVLK